MDPTSEATRWRPLDLAFLALATVAAARLWGDCSPMGEVAGDSFVPLQCGWQFLLEGWAVPSQNIFGWGLCATFAPFFIGAESIVEVAYRRAFAASLVVPLAYVTARSLLPSITTLSLPAVQVGSLCAAASILSSPGVGRPSSSGGHGYLAWTWIALCIAALAFASRPTRSTRGRLDRAARILAAIVGVAAIPMAAMNHPFAAWVAAPAIVLLPLGFKRAGPLALSGGLVAGWLLAAPRVQLLREMVEAGDGWTSFAHQPGSERLLDLANARAWIFDGQDAVLLLGFVAFLIAAFASRQRFAGVSWGLAGLAGLGALVFLGRKVGYLQDYHVMTMHPFAAVGVGATAGLVLDFAGRYSTALPTFARGVGAVAIAAGLTLGVSEANDIDGAERPWYQPWCPMHPPDAGKAHGLLWYERAILKDLSGPDAPDTFLITDLNLGKRTVDGSVVLGLSLHIGGVPADRMSCCATEDQWSDWYMISDLYDEQVDWDPILAIPGIDLLVLRGAASELMFAVRTPEALDALGEVLCGAIAPTQIVSVNYYNELMELLDSGAQRLPAPSPTPPCIRRRQLD
jgi:hypothetical protein